MNKWVLIFIAFVGLATTYAVAESSFQADMGANFQAFQEQQRREVMMDKNRFELAIDIIYSSLRTIAQLPDIRRIDRYGKNFDKDAFDTVQQIYNNLASQVKVSELYIVPDGINPDRLDSVTGKMEAPITTFDHLIVGQSADEEGKNKAQLEEVEIYEYRRMKKQSEYFKNSFFNRKLVPLMDFPALASDELITCDNTEFSKKDLDSGNDEARKGFVYSVPFYDENGNYKGMISAVVRTRIIERMFEYPYLSLVRGKEGSYRIKAGVSQGLPGKYDTKWVDACSMKDEKKWFISTQIPAHVYLESLPAKASLTKKIYTLVAGCVINALILFIAWRLLNEKKMAQDLAEQMTLSLKSTIKDLEDAKLAAESAAAAKSQFLANMSHEIRTPLNAIIGFSKLLIGTPLEKTQKEYLQTIGQSSEILMSIVNNVLDFSKIEAGQRTLEKIDFDLEYLVQSIIKVFNTRPRSGRVRLGYEYEEGLPKKFRGDPSAIRQCLINFVSNAIKFTNEGSILVRVLGVGGTDLGFLRLRISTVDTGIGIPQDKIDDIFKPFEQADISTTREYGGTGLGLSITKSLIELMDGRVWVESEEKKGSKFNMEIPLEVAMLERPNESIDLEKKLPADMLDEDVFKKLKILVAEDNTVNQKLIGAILRKLGCQVDIAANGALALEQLKNFPYDLCLMDLQMPVMGGVEAARLIRSQKGMENFPIIALTAAVTIEDQAQCREVGMNEFLTKPIDFEMLKKALAVYAK